MTAPDRYLLITPQTGDEPRYIDRFSADEVSQFSAAEIAELDAGRTLKLLRQDVTDLLAFYDAAQVQS